MYYVYIVKCSDGSFYTGVARDLDKRIDEHNYGVLGAKYTRTRRPVSLVYAKRKRNRSYAQKEEARIKNLSKEEKIKLIEKYGNSKKK